MKKPAFTAITLSIFCLLSLFSGLLMAQVSISNDNSQPDNSAMLDVKSTQRGFLLPRMSREQRDAISNPAEGLMVICTDCGYASPVALSVFINGTWKLLTGFCSVPGPTTAGTHTAAMTQITWNWSTVPGALGYKWNTVNNSQTAIDVGNVTSRVETGLNCNTWYTRFVWAYNDCGISSVAMLWRSTTVVLPATPAAAAHLPAATQITWKWRTVSGATSYKWSTLNNVMSGVDVGSDTTYTETGLTCLTAYTRYVWAIGPCGNSNPLTMTASTTANPPPVPVSGTHTSTRTTITWNWGPSTGATGYKWNTVNNPATATDIGNVFTLTETGLGCDSAYTRYLWAYGVCGTSAACVLTKATPVCWLCGEPFTDARDGQSYGSVVIGTTCWMSKNLNTGVKIDGSLNQTNNAAIEKYCFNDLDANCAVYGGLYQWNEMMAYAASSAGNPSGVTGICPSGWHVPSAAEWCQMEKVIDPSTSCGSGAWTGPGGELKETGTTHWFAPNTGATNTSGFTALPAGVRGYMSGFGNQGYYAFFWTSTEENSANCYTRKLNHDWYLVYHGSYDKNYGFSLRCVKN
jgi:uncharacterized protein (TIGR02145 family)